MLGRNYKYRRRLPASSVVLTLTDFPTGQSVQAQTTWESVNIGPASSDRYVIVSVAWSNNAALDSTGGITINGEAATLIRTSASSTSGIALFMSANPVTTGTTCTIVVTLSGTALGIGLYVFSLTKATTSTPTKHNLATGTTTSVTTSTNNINEGGCLLAVAVWSTTETGDWTGVTKQDQRQIKNTSGTADMSCGYLNNMAAETGRSVTISRASSTAMRLITASWR